MPKTDPFRKEREIVTGSRTDALCLVMAYKLLQAHKAKRGLEYAECALFCSADGRPAAYKEINDFVKKMARNAGCADCNKYSGHSFRKGATIAYLTAGVRYDLVRKRGGLHSAKIPDWYIHEDPFQVNNIVRPLKQTDHVVWRSPVSPGFDLCSFFG